MNDVQFSRATTTWPLQRTFRAASSSSSPESATGSIAVHRRKAPVAQPATGNVPAVTTHKTRVVPFLPIVSAEDTRLGKTKATAYHAVPSLRHIMPFCQRATYGTIGRAITRRDFPTPEADRRQPATSADRPRGHAGAAGRAGGPQRPHPPEDGGGTDEYPGHHRHEAPESAWLPVGFTPAEMTRPKDRFAANARVMSAPPTHHQLTTLRSRR